VVAADEVRHAEKPLPQADRFEMRRFRPRLVQIAGQPLDDDDRLPWLAAIGRWIDEKETADRPAIVACSALRRRYREVLSDGRSGVWFACLDASHEELERRVRSRQGHFMPASLVEDQRRVLEPLGSDEPGVVVDASQPLETVVASIIGRLP
jgi:gluconokinase